MSWFGEYIHFALSLLAICTPQSAIPIFMAMTKGMGHKEKTNVAKQAMLTIFFALTVSSFFGAQILNVFGISLDSFRFIGGIMLMNLALSMLRAQEDRHTEDETQEASERASMGIVPLGLPIIAGPGAISTVIIAAQTNPSLMHMSVVVSSIATVAGICCACLIFSEKLGALLGQTGLNIMTRVFGMLVGALSIEFMYKSLAQMFPAWTSVLGA